MKGYPLVLAKPYVMDDLGLVYHLDMFISTLLAFII